MVHVMALFNKLFSGLKTIRQNNHEDNNVSHKVSSFNTEQVRLVLFRECDFRGRKLLFDSDATEKVLMEKAEPDQKFVEVSNGYGYLVVSKQNSDYQELSEMVFGSVAMSFRGTYLKIHSLDGPPRLIFTQVFPSPHGRRPKSSSTSSNQSHLSTQSSFEHSIKLDDSGSNSAFSTSDRLSDRSTASDTVLVCRRAQSSPLDVPGIVSSFSRNSLVVDSGCADQSFSSTSTGPLNFPTWESLFSHKDLSTISFSSSGIFKRLLRSSTRSLQSSSVSLPNSSEVLHKSHHKGSKLGLTIIVYIPAEKDKFLTQFFMEHIALLEALIWRTRRVVEMAYHRPSTFISLMVDIAQNAASWLVNLLNAPCLVTNLWHCLSFSCDNCSSINAFMSDLDNKSVNLCRTFRNKSAHNLSSGVNSDNKLSFSKSFNGLPIKNGNELLNFNFSRFLKTDWDVNSRKRATEVDLVAEGFLKEFCELLEGFDVKDTNFFISTLLTAVLTHHLGWVASVFPSSASDSESIFNLKQPYNALWSQLTDLYGAIGHPVKTAQTVITGSNKNDVISKLLNSLTYFIRFGNVERMNVCRTSIEGENKTANLICIKNNCIPKENYKKYEDHLKELLTPESPKPSCSNGSNTNNLKEFRFSPLNNAAVAESVPRKRSNIISTEEIKICNKEQQKSLKQSKGLTKIQSYTGLTCLAHEQSEEPSQKACLSRVPSSLGDVLKTNIVKQSSTRNLQSFVTQDEFTKLPSEGCDQNQNSFSMKVNDTNIKTLAKSCNFTDLANLEKKTELEGQSNCKTTDIQDDKNSVIFVLGENEKLVGIKKEEHSPLSSSYEDKTELGNSSGAKRKISLAKRPSSLSLSKTSFEFSKTRTEIISGEPPTDLSCKKCLMHGSCSYESLSIEKKETRIAHSEISPLSNMRAQSEPPIIRKVTPPKYQYSRVKFNLQQYPQVVKNYMKSKNIELEGLSLGEKVFDKFATVQHNIKLDFSGYESDSEEVEALQTPSNASELEFTPDMGTDAAEEDSKEASNLDVAKNMPKFMKIINIPMPKSLVSDNPEYSVPYMSTVIKGLVDTYIPDMVLQGTTNPKNQWDAKLKSNLAINTQHSLLDQPVDEALAIVANTDTWEVQVISSHTYVIDKGTNGVRAGMSQLVANMLDSLLQMWKLHIPPQYCILHIEQRLQELCVRSKALAQMLLASEFCSIELLTSTLRIEVNDVPLLMAVASTHTPEVTQKYGLSFH